MWRLGRRKFYIELCYRGPLGPRDITIQDFQSGETSSIPGACVPPAAEDCSAINGVFP